jgi:glycosyltransferase involved in cell wall biosynthesis
MTTRGSDPTAGEQPETSGTSRPHSRISIALCTYNGARFLDAQLASYLTQTRLPDELVVCDDGSTDGTQAILERFVKQAPFPVRVEHNPARLGSTRNFEKVIGLCTGELIATSDQDDVWLPRKLAISEAALAVDPQPGLVFSDADVVDDDLRPLGHTMWQAIHLGPSRQRRVRSGETFPILLRQWLVTGATMMFRASYLPCVLPIPEIWIHDGWIAFIIGALAPLGLLGDSTVQYRQHAAQQIGGKKLGWRELYELAQTLGPEHFRLAYERFRLARERLHALAPRLRDPKYLELLDQKVEHQRRRLAIAESRSRAEKALWTLGELLRWRYQRYSPGLTHCLKDLFL